MFVYSQMKMKVWLVINEWETEGGGGDWYRRNDKEKEREKDCKLGEKRIENNELN